MCFRSCRLLEPDMTLIKLQEKKGEPDSVVQQLRSLMMHFNRLVEDEGIVSQLWGRVRSFLVCALWTEGMELPEPHPRRCLVVPCVGLRCARSLWRYL